MSILSVEDVPDAGLVVGRVELHRVHRGPPKTQCLRVNRRSTCSRKNLIIPLFNQPSYFSFIKYVSIIIITCLILSIFLWLYYHIIHIPLVVLSYYQYSFGCIIILSIFLWLYYHIINIPLVVLSYYQYSFGCIIILSIFLWLYYHIINIPLVVLSYYPYSFGCIHKLLNMQQK